MHLCIIFHSEVKSESQLTCHEPKYIRSLQVLTVLPAVTWLHKAVIPLLSVNTWITRGLDPCSTAAFLVSHTQQQVV